jgi:hypothetical protein
MNRITQKLFLYQNGFTCLSLVMLVMFSIMSSQLHAAVTANLDRQIINLGDTVTMHIITSGDDQGKQPNLKPLEKDFEVLGTSNSSEIQIINGQRSDKHEWLIELAPLAKGSITIPSLTIGDRKTKVLTLQVNEQPAATTAEAGEPVFIQSEVSSSQDDTYVQQQILYTTRLYYRIPLVEGNFTSPKIENAVVEQLGEDKQYDTTVKGHSYQVLERRYAIFPEHSGQLNIMPTVFNGRLVSESNRSSSFSHMDNLIDKMLSQRGFNIPIFGDSLFSSPGKKIRLAGNPISLEVKARPDTYTGTYWLPTQSLVLQDSWDSSPPVIHAGEPVTRTLILEAKGLEASQLPDIQMETSDALRIYPEQAELSNQTDGDWVYGRSEQRFTYVASKPGKFHVPALQITWWDSLNQKQQSSVLPARDFTILPGSNPSSAASVGTQTQQTNQSTQATATVTTNVTPPANNAPAVYDKIYWLLAGGFAVALLLFTGYFFLRRQRNTKQPVNTLDAQDRTNDSSTSTLKSNNKRAAHYRKALQDACTKSDPQAAAQSLLAWAAVMWPDQPPRSLSALAERVEQGAAPIRDLETVLYSAHKQQWEGRALWSAISKQPTYSKRSVIKQHFDGAPPLYPDLHKQTG